MRRALLPLPWVSEEVIEDCGGRALYLVDSDGEGVGQAFSPGAADIITRAVNAHDELVAALRNAEKFLKHTPEGTLGELYAAGVRARAVLAKLDRLA